MKIRARYPYSPIWVSIDHNSVGQATIQEMRRLAIYSNAGVDVADIAAHGGCTDELEGREWNVAKGSLIDAGLELVRRRDVQGQPLLVMPSVEAVPAVSKLEVEMRGYERKHSRSNRTVSAAAGPGYSDDRVSALQMGAYTLQQVYSCTATKAAQSDFQGGLKWDIGMIRATGRTAASPKTTRAIQSIIRCRVQ